MFGMVQRGEHLRFAPEARQPLGIEGEVVGQDLQRDVALQCAVASAIHFAHPAGPEDRENFVGAEASAGRERQ